MSAGRLPVGSGRSHPPALCCAMAPARLSTCAASTRRRRDRLDGGPTEGLAGFQFRCFLNPAVPKQLLPMSEKVKDIRLRIAFTFRRCALDNRLLPAWVMMRAPPKGDDSILESLMSGLVRRGFWTGDWSNSSRAGTVTRGMIRRLGSEGFFAPGRICPPT